MRSVVRLLLPVLMPLFAQTAFGQLTVTSTPISVCSSAGAAPPGARGLRNFPFSRSVTIPGNTVLTFTFSAPITAQPLLSITGGATFPGGFNVATANNTVTVTLPGGATFPDAFSGLNLVGTVLDPRGVPDNTNVTVTVSTTPANAVTFSND